MMEYLQTFDCYAAQMCLEDPVVFYDLGGKQDGQALIKEIAAIKLHPDGRYDSSNLT